MPLACATVGFRACHESTSRLSSLQLSCGAFGSRTHAVVLPTTLLPAFVLEILFRGDAMVEGRKRLLTPLVTTATGSHAFSKKTWHSAMLFCEPTADTPPPPTYIFPKVDPYQYLRQGAAVRT